MLNKECPKVPELPKAPQMSPQHLAKLIRKVDAGTYRKVIEQTDTLGKDVFNEVLYFNLLSNPTTHVVNVFGSSVVAPAVSMVTRSVAAGMGKFRKLNTDDLIAEPLNAPVTMGEVASSISGYFNGFAMARKAIVDSWKLTGEGGKGYLARIDALRDMDSPLAVSKFDQGSKAGIDSKRLGVKDPYLAATVDGLGAMIRSTSTALKLGDLLSSNINYSMELHSLAYRKTMAKGLTGDAFDAEYARQIANPDKDVVASAKQFAAIQTFTNALDGRLASMQNMLSHPVTKVIAPFVATPTNIFRYNLSYLPGINYALKGVREDIQAGGARADIVRAKMAIGTALIGSLLVAAANDQITGSGPADKSQRAVYFSEESGRKPNSVKIGGQWIGLNRFDPVIGSYIGLVADFHGMMQDMPEAKIPEMGVMLMGSFFRNFTSKTWAESAFEFSDLIHMGKGEKTEDLMKSVDMFVQRHAKMAVPGAQGLGAINQSFFDDTIREVSTWQEAMKAQIPGWSKSLKPNLDYFGDVNHKNNLGPDMLSPINIHTGKKDPVVEEIRKQRVELPTVPRVVDGQPLSSDEYHDFKHAFAKEAKVDGKTLHAYLESIIANKKSVYWQLPEAAGPSPLSHRSEFLKQMVGQFLDQAKQIMAEKNSNPKFIRVADEIKKAKARGEQIDEAGIKRGLGDMYKQRQSQQKQSNVTIAQP